MNFKKLMRSIVLSILSMLFTIIAFGQNRIYYHTNIFDRTFIRCQKPPMFGTDSLELQKYLTDKLESQIPKVEGNIQISILIDTAGKPFCEWIDNNSLLNTGKNKLNLIIDSMPAWNCGIQNGFKVNSAQQIEMMFNKKDLKVTYLRSKN